MAILVKHRVLTADERAELERLTLPPGAEGDDLGARAALFSPECRCLAWTAVASTRRP